MVDAFDQLLDSSFDACSSAILSDQRKLGFLF